VRPVTVDATRLEDLVRRLVDAERRVRDGSADVEVVAAAVVSRSSGPTLGAAAVQAVGWALRVRQQLLQSLRALASVVLVVSRGYRETERQLCAEVASLAGTLSLTTSGDGVLEPGARAGLVGDAAAHGDGGSWAAVTTLLWRLSPPALEGLLVGAPALARRVVDAAPPGERTPGGRLSVVLWRAALLAPAAGALLVAAELASMPPGLRRAVALLHPRLMTGAAAAPPADRFAASRVLVAADLARLNERRRTAPAEERARLDRRISWERDLLDAKVELRRPNGAVSRHAHQIVEFDPSGDGRIVEVIGDLGRAEHLAVFVPGTGSDLDRYPGTFARMLPFAAADPSLAVVVWQGADHPDQPFDDGRPPLDDLVSSAWRDPGGVPGAIRSWPREHVIAAGLRDAADVAGPALARDVAGLRAAAAGPASDLTVLGHSYGGSIVGSAELHGMVADRVVHIASAGAYVDDVSRYTAPPSVTQRFSMTAFDDPIRLSQGHDGRDAGARLRQLMPGVLDPLTVGLPDVADDIWGPASQVGHGRDPDLMPGVVRLDTGVHDDGTLVQGHSGMFQPGSTAWRNLLAVMTRGKVEVLEPQRWRSHLEPLQLPTVRQEPGHPSVPDHPPRYVVDASPYGDPRYQPPVLDLVTGEVTSR
jgi:hypothetical protein